MRHLRMSFNHLVFVAFVVLGCASEEYDLRSGEQQKILENKVFASNNEQKRINATKYKENADGKKNSGVVYSQKKNSGEIQTEIPDVQEAVFSVGFYCSTQMTIGNRATWADLGYPLYFDVVPLRWNNTGLAIKVFDLDGELINTINDEGTGAELVRDMISGKEINVKLGKLKDGKYDVLFCDRGKDLAACVMPSSDWLEPAWLANTPNRAAQVHDEKMNNFNLWLTNRQRSAPDGIKDVVLLNRALGGIPEIEIKSGEVVSGLNRAQILADIDTTWSVTTASQQSVKDTRFNYEFITDPNSGSIGSSYGTFQYVRIVNVPAPYNNCDVRYSPLMIDLSGNGIEISSARDGVSFEISGDGVPKQTAWPLYPEYSVFLALDRNDNDSIDSIHELFGNKTRSDDGSEVANGFLALAKFDTDQNYRIDQNDEVFKNLLLWSDKDRDGISETSELKSLSVLGIEYIDLNYQPGLETDAFGNESRQRSIVKYSNGESRLIFDVWFTAEH